MPSPSIVVFDLGKVLVDFDYSIAARKIAAKSTKPPENLHSFLSSSPALIQFETGLISRREFFDTVRSAIDYQGTFEEFGAHFADIFSEIKPMIRLHNDLRQLGFPLYLLSNTNDLAVEHVRRNFPFFNHFDGYTLSYEVRSMKPDAGIYESLEKLSGKRGAEILYIDDRPENIEAGAVRGWLTILHENPEQTLEGVRKLNLL
jgi:HAD superfamily hydrolase (TIGR01509 family)